MFHMMAHMHTCWRSLYVGKGMSTALANVLMMYLLYSAILHEAHAAVSHLQAFDFESCCAVFLLCGQVKQTSSTEAEMQLLTSKQTYN